MSLRQALRSHPAGVAFVALWCALTIVALIPVWHQRMLPMLDTPDHLALARAWHSYHDPSYRIAEYYTLRVRLVPYFLFYFLIHLLLYVAPIEIANKLVLSAYLILFPLSVLSLARALQRSPWLALGAFALAFNPGWIYGFSSYLLGTCFLFFGWAALIRYLDRGRPGALWGLAATTTLAYLSHVMAWALLGAGAIALLALEWRQLRRVALAAAAMAPSLLLAIAAFLQERREHAYINREARFSAVWRDVPTSVQEFPKRAMELFPGSLDQWTLAVVAITVVIVALWPRLPRPADAPRATRRLTWLLVLLAVAYLALPYSIKQPMSWWYVAPRLPALMTPLLLLAPAGLPGGWRRLVMLPMVAACFVLPVKLTRLYGDFNRRNIGFLRLVDRLPRGGKTMVLARGLIAGDPESSGDPSSSAPVYWHFMSWPMALHGGFSPYLFDQGIPVQPRPALPSFNVARTDALDLRSAPQFDYYLVHESSDVLRPDRSVRETSRIGSWTLYQRIAPMTDEP